MKPLKPLYVFLVNHTGLNKLLTFATFIITSNALGGDVFISAMLSYIVFKVLNPTRTSQGFFTVSGHQYKYFYGDHLKIAGEKLNGIQVELPAFLPHVFVDLHSNNGRFGLQRSFTDIKKYNLEGDFGTDTTVYARHVDRLEVLTVLNPNTMRVLLDIARVYDFECIENRLMLYSRKKIYYNQIDSQQLVSAAQAVVESLHQSLLYSDLLNKKKTSAMKVIPSDRYITFGKYGVGSARKIIALFVSLVISVWIILSVMGTYGVNSYANNEVGIIRVLLVICWIILVPVILYIGFSRKKIDIRTS